MTTKPFVNAVLASGYICLIVTFFSYVKEFEARTFGMIAPITFLSLLVFSAALMGYLILYQPLRLLVVERESEAASRLFFSTLAAFATIIAALIVLWFALAAIL